MAEMKYLDAPVISERTEYFTSVDGTEYELSKSFLGVLQIVREFGIQDRLRLIGISDNALEKYLKGKIKPLSKEVHQLLKSKKWHWRETGQKVEIDDDFINDFLDLDIKKETLYTKLRENRLPIKDLLHTKKFFESEEIFQIN